MELWHGIKREEIGWYPTVDTHKCIGCELCFVTCGRMVYAIDHEAKKALVAEPYKCMVGCTTCANICPTNAISFPDKAMVQRIEREFKIFSLVHKEAKEKSDKIAAKAQAANHLSTQKTRIDFEVAGNFGDKRFIVQLYEFIKEKPCDIIDVTYLNPTLKGTIEHSAPSMMRFSLVSERYDDITELSNTLRGFIIELGFVVTNERNG